MPTSTHLRLHLSTMLPLNGDKIIVTNMDTADMMPISPLDPVCSYTQ